jgi:hypothetical protein
MSDARMAYVLMDTVDPGQTAPFWSELLGVGVATTVGDGDFVVLAPGGVWLDGETREIEGYRWRCMADPQGNEFDIVPADN